MTNCQCCSSKAKTFDATVARRDLRRFRRRGPDGPTREILVAVESRALPAGSSLIDIGGGVGAIHHVLLDHNFTRATHIDASPAYLAAAADESERRHHTDRVSFRMGDFHSVGAETAPADVVTLDRVVCCDADYVGMLGTASALARRFLAFSYPRPSWLARLVVSASNTWRRLLGNDFRAYIHPPARMEAVLEQAGMRKAWSGGTWIWAVELFERPV